MSFLDNLENSLKNLEDRDERDTSVHERRQAERDQALAVAPWAESLKSSPYTAELMNLAAAAGHQIRAKVYMAWLGNVLRFEVRGKKMELRPTADGITAVFLDGLNEISRHQVDLNGNPQELLDLWFQQF
jgi:hypothetical protein